MTYMVTGIFVSGDSRSRYTKVDPHLGHLDIRVPTVLVLVVEYNQIKGPLSVFSSMKAAVTGPQTA